MPTFGEIKVTYRGPTQRQREFGLEGCFTLTGPYESFDISINESSAAEMLDDAITDNQIIADDDGGMSACTIAPSTVREIVANSDSGAIPGIEGDLADAWKWMRKQIIFIFNPRRRRYFRTLDKAAKERNFKR
jgi:hypothetical protein